MRREVNIALRSLSILALAGSKDFYRRLRLILFKKRQVFLFDKWRESRERKRRLARRARVASLSSQQEFGRELRFSRLFKQQQFRRHL